ncbi:phosphopentomutase [Microbulbifer harenosus]|uniref:Phosphopentomutase n=1 Tax=Microbulbifer harenosus TaxID=2576840 RepID=A0ABY2UH71_9GAMM|nr:phosphopentomutase [Microbulbifer harenosus]TLM77005.1 phosphopentomutase [Microbulbifer harenosus]
MSAIAPAQAGEAPRAFILVMDSVGIGATADADQFGDAGANTLGHIIAGCRRGQGDREGLRQGPLAIPNLLRLGLGHALKECGGAAVADIELPPAVAAAYGHCAEVSAGKDTPSGHWEIAGLPVTFDWTCFPDTVPAFPTTLTDELIRRGGLPGILGNCHASGTAILRELGEAHIQSGKPIVYTSADSVVQIAAHEIHFGLDRLLSLCETARVLVDPLNVGRVIARPFVGDSADAFARTGNRRDYTTPPHGTTLLDQLQCSGGQVVAVGKISDIFAGRGIGRSIKAHGNMALFDATLEAADEPPEKPTLVFTNFVDFDTLYGHRRDLPGYAAALEELDRRLPELEARLRPGDIAVITADHGCDPTWPGSDHTREHVPALFFGPGISPVRLGRRHSFADIGQTLAEFFRLPPLSSGCSFYSRLNSSGRQHG